MDIRLKLYAMLLAHHFEITEHALEALDDDGFSLDDVTACVALCKVRRSWPRQRKHELEGRATDGRAMRVVVRLIRSDWLRIITVYEIH